MNDKANLKIPSKARTLTNLLKNTLLSSVCVDDYTDRAVQCDILYIHATKNSFCATKIQIL